MSNQVECIFDINYGSEIELEFAIRTGKRIPLRDRRININLDKLQRSVRQLILDSMSWENMREYERAFFMENSSSYGTPKMFLVVELNSAEKHITQKNINSILRMTRAQIAQNELIDVTINSVHVVVSRSDWDKRVDREFADLDYGKIVE